MNETIRIATRIVVSLLIMIIVSFLSHRDDSERLNRFYAKMRTKVLRDQNADADELELSLKYPHRHDDLLLWPGSNWEFLKWDREDIVGFFSAVVCVGGTLLLMTFLVNLGS